MTREDQARDDVASAQASRKEALWSVPFVLIILSNLLLSVCGQGLNTSSSVYVELYGGTATYSGVLAAVFSIAAAVVRIACGEASDKHGRWAVLLVGNILYLAGVAGPVFIPGIEPFFFFRILQGLGFGISTTTVAAAAADVLPQSRIGEGIGYSGLGQALSYAIGPALALFVLGDGNADALFMAMSAVMIIALVMCLFVRYEKHPEQLSETSGYRERLRERENPTMPAKKQAKGFAKFIEVGALPGAIPVLFSSPAFGFGLIFVSLMGARMGVAQPGLFFTVAAVSMLVIRLGSGAFMDKFPPLTLYAVSTASGVVGFLMLYAASALSGSNDLLFYSAGLPYGVFAALNVPVNQSIAVQNTPSDRWGAASACMFLSLDIGIAIASVVWGMINDAWGFESCIVGVLLCLAVSFVLAAKLYRAVEKAKA